MSANVEFFFDFGVPNAYLAHLAIPAIEARTGAKFDYVPILLGGVFRDPYVKARLIANTEKAVERGVFGSPTFFVREELFLGKDKLGEVEEEILSQRSPRS